MKRIRTGIRGFDKLIEGGFPERSKILVTGNPGTGKTIFGIEFIYNGIKKFDENGIYVVLEEKKDNILRQAKQFEWEFERYEKKGKLRIIEIPYMNIEKDTVDFITRIIEEKKIKRVVIDSVSTLAINSPEVEKTFYNSQINIKKFVYSFMYKISKTNATFLIISHTTKDNEMSVDGVSEFLCDGIIMLNFESLGGNFSRSLAIKKMRWTKNNEEIHPFEIGKKGIVVYTI